MEATDNNKFMTDQSNLPDLIAKFRALKTHAEKCEFLHQPDVYPVLGRIIGPVHYPKPDSKPAVKLETK